MWFCFKGKPDIHHAPFHVLCKVQLLRLLSPDTQEIVAPHMKPCMPIVSVFHCHDFCDDPGLRTFALGKLLGIRNRSYQGDASVRVIVISPLNLMRAHLALWLIGSALQLLSRSLHLICLWMRSAVSWKRSLSAHAFLPILRRCSGLFETSLRRVIGSLVAYVVMASFALELLHVKLCQKQIQNQTLLQWQMYNKAFLLPV